MSKDRIKWKDLKPSVRQAATRALGDAAEFLLQEANKTVPHDEGHLQRSGLVSISQTEAVAHVSYDTPYARRLHEHPEYNFQKGRRGKWLESTINEQSDKVVDYLKRELGRVLN